MKRLIFLALAQSNPRAVRRRLQKLATDSPMEWAFLGRDYRRTLEWQQALGDSCSRLSLDSRLQELAQSWRDPYLEWIGSVKRPDLVWWSSVIAEKNTLADSLYHSICYTKIGTELIGRGGAPLLLVAEHESVLRAIEENLPGEKFRRIGLSRIYREELRLLARFFYAWSRYAARSVGEMRDARGSRRAASIASSGNGRLTAIIHTCIDESYFGSDGKPHDRYFHQLPAFLRQAGFRVRTLPWLFNIRRSRREAFDWLRQHGDDVLIPEDEYRLRDYLWSAGVVMRQIRAGSELRSFQGLAARALVRCAQLEQAGTEANARFVRYHRLVQHWAARGERVDVFIDMFENMTAEKPQVMALRRFMPRTLTVGFQHYVALPPLQLCLRTTPSEAADAPHPDVIVCNSRYTQEELKRAGFPESKLRVGASFRYAHIPALPLRADSRRGRVVLIVMALEESASREMLLKLFEAFPQSHDIEFRIKLHPMAPAGFLQELLTQLPVGFVRVEGDLAHHLAEAACAVVVASTSAFELALAGIPLVIVGRESDFDHNPLHGQPDFPSPAVSVVDLRRCILDRLAEAPEHAEHLRAWAMRMRTEAFAPVNPDVVRAFVTPIGTGDPRSPANGERMPVPSEAAMSAFQEDV